MTARTGALLVRQRCGMACGILALIFVLSTVACNRSKSVSASKLENGPASAKTEGQFNPASLPADSAPLPSINSARAWKYTKEVTAFGPRPVGSVNHKKLEKYIHARLTGIDVEDDDFTADTIEGQFPIHNIIAKFPGTKDGIIILAGHYDTNYPFRNNGYVGANDGGSSTGLLLELAGQLRGKKQNGYSVWLLWTDGEEAMKEWTSTDSVYGTRHLAEVWQRNGTLNKIKAFIVEDMIGDADLNIDHDQTSAPWLESVVYQAATRLGDQSHFFRRELIIEDDHTPLIHLGVPCADLIDFDYGYNNVFWHTPQDTLDKLSPKSLQIVGDVMLETVRILNAMPSLPPK